MCSEMCLKYLADAILEFQRCLMQNIINDQMPFMEFQYRECAKPNTVWNFKNVRVMP